MNKLTLLFWLALLPFTPSTLASPVNINTADAKTLADALKGIGMKKAEAIVKYRTENGPFKTVKELANVSGIGEKTLEKNQADILLEGTPPISAMPIQKKPR